MDGFAALGPLPYRVTISRPFEEKHKDAKHLFPKLSRSRSLPHERCAATRPGHEYEEHHRRELLALGLFLTAAAQTNAAFAGQSNGQLADEVRCIMSIRNERGRFCGLAVLCVSEKQNIQHRSGAPLFCSNHPDRVSRALTLAPSLQYYTRTDTIVRQIKDILSADITSGDNQEKLEGFKRDASAYGECHTAGLD